jgi:hypothetical protein
MAQSVAEDLGHPPHLPQLVNLSLRNRRPTLAANFQQEWALNRHASEFTFCSSTLNIVLV